MPQADFVYGVPEDKGASRNLSIFADRPHLREQLREDAALAGFAIRTAGPLAMLLEDRPVAMGEAALIDCPAADGSAIEALAWLDDQAACTGAQLVVSTSIGALDAMFACCTRSDPQILVDPTRAERIIALGRLLASGPGARLREMSEADRLTLLRLTEQVGQIASKLDAFGVGAGHDGGLGLPEAPDRVNSPAMAFQGETDGGSERLVRQTRPPVPDPRLVRRIIRQRQLRARFIEGNLFADPAWDILLDLTAARAEHVRVSVSSLCIAAGVPPTTALRWISQLTDAGLLQRVEDEADRRRAFIALTEKTADAVARYFAEIGRGAAQLV